MFRACAVVLLIGGISIGNPGDALSADRTSISIGTGGVTGVYYPAGGAICRLMNRERSRHGIRCSVESTGGSVANINGIREGALDFGLVQSDWQSYAYSGAPAFDDRTPFTELRAVFSLHTEPFTVVARADSGIRQFSDLKGKRVNIGNPGSGQRGTMDIVLKSIGWTIDDFAAATELSSDEQSLALCQGRIDAMVFVVGHPSASIKEATTTCAAVLVDAGRLERLMGESPFYREVHIPAGMYAGTRQDISTFGVFATLVTSSRVPDETVYQLVEAVFRDFAEFKKQHPAFKDLNAREMATAGLTAPLHPGAVRYYEQAGWR